MAGRVGRMVMVISGLFGGFACGAGAEPDLPGAGPAAAVRRVAPGSGAPSVEPSLPRASAAQGPAIRSEVMVVRPAPTPVRLEPVLDRNARVPVLPSGPAQVEGLDDRGAWLIPLDGSAGVMVHRWQLPADAREGDVVQGGKVDRQATAALHAWITEKLQEIERAGRPLPLGRPPLTHR